MHAGEEQRYREERDDRAQRLLDRRIQHAAIDQLLHQRRGKHGDEGSREPRRKRAFDEQVQIGFAAAPFNRYPAADRVQSSSNDETRQSSDYRANGFGPLKADVLPEWTPAPPRDNEPNEQQREQVRGHHAENGKKEQCLVTG